MILRFLEEHGDSRGIAEVHTVALSFRLTRPEWNHNGVMPCSHVVLPRDRRLCIRTPIVAALFEAHA